MAADASIYAMLQPLKPPADPMQQYGQMLQIGNLMDAGAVNQLQRRKMESDIAEEDAVKQLFARGNPTADQISAISPTRGMQFRKSQLEDETGRANLAKTRAETLAKQLGIHRDQLAGVNTPQDAAQWIMAGFNDPALSPILQRLGGPQEHISKIPQDPQGFADWKRRNGLGIEKMLEMTAPKVSMTDTGATVTPVQTNPLAAGGVGPVPGAAAIPKTQTAADVAAQKQRTETAISNIRKEFNDVPEVKNFRSVVPIFNSAVKAPDSRAGDIQFAYTIGKIFDPNSVVREGELRLVGEAATWLQKYEGELRTFLEGKGRLSPKTRQELLDTALSRINELKASHDAAKDTYGRHAKSQGLPEDQIFINMPKLEVPKPKGTASRIPLSPGASSGGVKFLGFE